MQKRGQSIGTVIAAAAVLIVAIALIAVLRSAIELSRNQEDVEALNLKQSIETALLRAAQRPVGSAENVSFAVPSQVDRLCLLAPGQADSLLEPRVTDAYDLPGMYLLRDGTIEHFTLPAFSSSTNPLCPSLDRGRVALELTSTAQGVDVVGRSYEERSCTAVLEQGHPRTKINVVFLPYGFDDTAEFTRQVSRYANAVLLPFPPFDRHADKFNIYLVDDASLQCTITNYIDCDHYQIELAASVCPHDQIVLLVDRGSAEDLLQPVRSSARGTIAKINIADKPFVLVHEMGHTLADLADEYVDEATYEQTFDVTGYVNCDFSTCAGWAGVNGTGCYPGCSLERYYRPTPTSIMRSLTSPTFGPVNEPELIKRLLRYE